MIRTATAGRYATKRVRINDRMTTRVEPTADDGLILHLAGGDTLRRRALFCHPVGRPATRFAADVGCRSHNDGLIDVDDLQRTSVPGVYAIGDMARRASMPMPAAQITAAQASGTIAAVACDTELVMAANRLPIPAHS